MRACSLVLPPLSGKLRGDASIVQEKYKSEYDLASALTMLFSGAQKAAPAEERRLAPQNVTIKKIILRIKLKFFPHLDLLMNCLLSKLLNANCNVAYWA
jgi:hypothetical protein